LRVGSSVPRGAVFLSYASQDAEAAKRIADALRGAGVEVWFDAEGGLEHGDEWDAKIRRQIKECVLFIPIISANTQAREEGYFRIEWELAAQRALGIASGVAFILPVLIDGTKEAQALVPDRFRSVQWTKLPGGNVPPEVLQRFLKLWSHRTGTLKHLQAIAGDRGDAQVAGSAGSLEPDFAARKRSRLPLILGAVGGLAVAGFAFLLLKPGRVAAPAALAPGTQSQPATPVVPLTEGQKLVARVQAIYDKGDDATNDEWALAEELGEQATKLEPMNAEAWAACSQVISMPYIFGFDYTAERLARVVKTAERAMSLAPNSVAARLALANCRRLQGPVMTAEAERIVRQLLVDAPDNWQVQRTAGNVLRTLDKIDEALACFDRAAALSGNHPFVLHGKARSYMNAGRFAEAEAIVDQLVAQNASPAAVNRKLFFHLYVHDDLDAAEALMARISPSFLAREEGALYASTLWLWRRDADQCIAALGRYSGESLNGLPKDYFAGRVYRAAGREAAARAAWQAYLQKLDQKLAAAPNDLEQMYWKVAVLAALDRRPEAEKLLETREQLKPLSHGERAFLKVLLGQSEGALDEFEAAAAERQAPVSAVFWFGTLRHDPMLDPVRSHPRFQATLARLAAKLPFVRRAGASAKSSAESSDAAKAPDDKSVAVLAFANLSDDKANEYFSDGISEELLNVLAKVPGLRVSARTSAFYFKGKDTPIPEIAQKLGVAYVVEGSVRKSGDKVRITAQLIKAADGFHVWSDTFTRDVKDIFAVQDEIAGLIAQNLELKIGVGQAKAIRAIDPEAHQRYLQGKFFLNQFSLEAVQRAVEHLQEAVKLAPDYAAAWAALSEAGAQIGGYGTTRAMVEEGYALARRAADRAIALDPSLPAGHLAMAGVKLSNDFDLPGAVKALRQAQSLAPDDPEVLSKAGLIQYALGQSKEAIAPLARAVALDPVNPSVRVMLGFALSEQERFAEAEAQFRRIVELNPASPWGHGGVSSVYSQQGRFDDAAREAALESNEWARLYALAIAQWGQGRTAEADVTLGQLISRYAGVAAYQIAEAYSMRGDRDRAFEWLERSWTQRDPGLTWSRSDPFLRTLHGDPRWPAFLKKIGAGDEPR
jgi:TolB-like protein/predicted Zn-dependent protease